jgi:hypothetical protein
VPEVSPSERRFITPFRVAERTTFRPSQQRSVVRTLSLTVQALPSGPVSPDQNGVEGLAAHQNSGHSYTMPAKRLLVTFFTFIIAATALAENRGWKLTPEERRAALMDPQRRAERVNGTKASLRQPTQRSWTWWMAGSILSFSRVCTCLRS